MIASKMLLQWSLRWYFVFLWILSPCLPESDSFASTRFLSPVIRSCHCTAGHAIGQNGTCEPANTSVNVFQEDSIAEYPTNLLNIKVGHLQCLFPKLPVVIQPGRELFLLPSGELYHSSPERLFDADQYCFDHIKESHGNVTWIAVICLTPPQVQVCCSSTSCKVNTIEALLGYSVLLNLTIQPVFQPQMKCQQNYTLVKKDLTTKNWMTAFHYDGEYTFLMSLESPGFASQLKYYTAEEFCLTFEESAQEERQVSSQVQYCEKDPLAQFKEECSNVSCVQKCCALDTIFDERTRSCILANDTMLWYPKLKGEEINTTADAHHLHTRVSKPLCTKFYAMDASINPGDEYELLLSGYLKVFSFKDFVPPHRYCMDNFISSGKVTEKVLMCFPDPAEIRKSVCDVMKDQLYPILLIASCVFLSVTLAVYTAVPELHAKVHGKCLLSHVTALLVAYLFLAIIRLASKDLKMTACIAFAFVVQISFLAAFFWLSVMCFDIWWTLRSMRPIADSSDTSRRRFCYYSAYAWGCPFLVGLVTCAMELMQFPPEYNLILPGFGEKQCWFKDNLSTWMYFYGFVSVITVSNGIFFLCVAIILFRAQRANNNILRNTNQQHKERVWLYLKLFIVMGITWICEVISWQEGSCEYWLIPDMINALQGFFIFLIFICKKNVFAMLQARIRNPPSLVKRLVRGTSSYTGSSQVSQQTSIESSASRKSSSILSPSIKFSMRGGVS